MTKVPNAINIAENIKRLRRAHERYRQTDRRQTDGRLHIANVFAKNHEVRSVTVTVTVGAVTP